MSWLLCCTRGSLVRAMSDTLFYSRRFFCPFASSNLLLFWGMSICLPRMESLPLYDSVGEPGGEQALAQNEPGFRLRHHYLSMILPWMALAGTCSTDERSRSLRPYGIWIADVTRCPDFLCESPRQSDAQTNSQAGEIRP
jgi:hypothetical protein